MNLLNNKKFGNKSRLFLPEFTENCIQDVEERAYISKKVYKVRWKPEGLDDYSSYFVTGSYDNPQNNGLDLWSFSQNEEQNMQSNVEFAPQHLSCVKTHGNVTEISFLDDKEHFAYCSSGGEVGVVKVNVKGGKEMTRVTARSGEDWFGTGVVSCSCLDVYEDVLAVGSLDGRICLMPVDGSKSPGTILGSVPTGSIKFISKDEVITGSLLGAVSLWDLRSNSHLPAQSFPLCRSQRVGVTCLTGFPTEKHMLVCGGRNGLISVFDARNLPIPVRVFSTTDSPLSELRFHPTRFSVLFSVSSQGDIWQWSNFFQLFDPLRKHDTSMATDTPIDQSLILEYKNVQPQVKCLLGNSKFYSNCIDVNKDRLLCGTDNECIIAVKSLQLK